MLLMKPGGRVVGDSATTIQNKLEQKNRRIT
jgi:hypothetical protein